MNTGNHIPRLKYYFVAFIDILGFSRMVRKDCDGPPTSIFFLPKLFDMYQSILPKEGTNESISVTQFSDSVVLSQLYAKNSFNDFANNVINFQHSLLIHGVLCRGGLSFGKHYERSNFLFSEGLIKAYRIENEEAIYPRIVIDSDLVDLLSPDGALPHQLIIQEADGACFLDYLSAGNSEQNFEAVYNLTVDWEKKSVRIREKLRWLREYCCFCHPDIDRLGVERFQRL